MGDVFRVQVSVRGYEIDAMGHLNSAVYLQFADHARWELFRAAGLDQQRLLADGIGPVSIETTIQFQNEVRYPADIDVSCEFLWGTGKTFRVRNSLTHQDGRVAAEVTNVGGLIDLRERKLVPRPDLRLLPLADTPSLLGLGS